MKVIAGGARLLKTLGVTASVLAALLFARDLAPSLGKRLAAPWAPWATRITAQWGSGFRLAQFTTYLVVLAIVAAGILLWTTLRRAIAARSPALGLASTAALVICAMLASFVIAWPLALMLIPVMATSSVLLAGSVTKGPRLPRAPEGDSTTLLILLSCEIIAGTWALWVACASRGLGYVIPALLGAGAAVTAYIALRRADKTAMERAAVGGAPALLLPLVGLLRAPGIVWFVLALVAGVGLAKLALTRRDIVHQATPYLLVVAAWSIASACIMPVGMRELASINYASHEAQHLGWVNSALDGRLLGADAGTFYGIVREYLLVAYCSLFGVTVEHVRMAHVLLNLAGLAVLLVATRSLIPRRPLLFLFLTYLFLFYTPLRCFCDIDLYIAFGWADALRSAAPVGVIVLTAHVLERGASSGLRPRPIHLVGCGALASLAVLYSQEFGLCGAASTLVTTVVFHLVGGRGLAVAVGQRLRASLVSVAAVVAGMALPIGLVLGVYAAYGKSGLLVKTTWTTLSLVGSCAFGCLDYPISAATFDRPSALFDGFVRGLQSPRHHDALVEFIVPVAVYILVGCYLITRLFARRWTPRCTPLVGLLALGICSYRMVLARASIDQLMNACAPAILCLGVLLHESIDFCVYVGRRRLRLGLLNAALLALAATLATERIGAIGHQVELIARGAKVPSGPVPFVYRDLPRGGDVYLDADFQALARFVRSVTREEDSIFTLLYMMDGGELYFLCDRTNPTRYDLLAEIITADQQREVLASLKAAPPRLIIGMDRSLVGNEVFSYVRARWSVSKQIGRYTVWMEPAAKVE